MRWLKRIVCPVICLVVMLCSLFLVPTGGSVRAATSGVLLSYPFSVGYPGGGGARCRVVTAPKTSGGYWDALLCGQNGYKDARGNYVEQLAGYFPQFNLNATATYNEGTGVLTLTYDDDSTGELRFNPIDEMGPAS